jgi:hypothetical protein
VHLLDLKRVPTPFEYVVVDFIQSRYGGKLRSRKLGQRAIVTLINDIPYDVREEKAKQGDSHREPSVADNGMLEHFLG